MLLVTFKVAFFNDIIHHYGEQCALLVHVFRITKGSKAEIRDLHSNCVYAVDFFQAAASIVLACEKEEQQF